MSNDWHINVEKKANEVLRKYGITECPAKELSRIANAEDITLNPVDHNDDSCGFFCIINGVKNIYYNTNMLKSRYNFTIAHELGHYFLEHELREEYSRLYRDFTKADFQKDPQEVEANYFAACLLVPRCMAKSVFMELTSPVSKGFIKPIRIGSKDNNIDELLHIISTYKKMFLISTQTAFYRLLTLGYLKVDVDFDINRLYSKKVIVKRPTSMLSTVTAFSDKLVVLDSYADLFTS